MSTKTLYQFFNKVAESEELQYRLDEGGEIDAEELIALGAECGCEFTAEDLQDEVDCWIDTKYGEKIDTGGDSALKFTYIPKECGVFTPGWLLNPVASRGKYSAIARLRGCRFVAFNINNYAHASNTVRGILPVDIKHYDTRSQFFQDKFNYFHRRNNKLKKDYKFPYKFTSKDHDKYFQSRRLEGWQKNINTKPSHQYNNLHN